MTNAHDTASPILYGQVMAENGKGLTAIEHAAIHTGQPVSGTEWLDDMIRAQRRERLAGQILQSLVARDRDDSAYGLDMVKARPLLACDYADALIAALEGGAK